MRIRRLLMIIDKNKRIMRHLMASAAAVFTLIWVSGCAYIPDNRFNKEVLNTATLSQINRVALLDVPAPSQIWLGDPEANDFLGLIFGSGALALLASRHRDYSATGIFNFSKTTQKEMRAWLERAGIEVILLEAKRANKSKMLEDYDQFKEVNADAILEVGPIDVGFKTEIASLSGELSPDISLAYRLVSATSGQTLIESNVYYSSFDYSEWSWPGTKLLGPREHLFEGVDSVRRQPAEAEYRLNHAVRGATKLIATMVTSGSVGVEEWDLEELALAKEQEEVKQIAPEDSARAGQIGYRIAIFPFESDSPCIGQIRPSDEKFAVELGALIAGNDSLQLAYSYYDKTLDEPPITEPGRLWAREKPHLSRVSALGEIHRVDAVVMYWRADPAPGSYCTDRMPPFPIDVYIIDLKQRKRYWLNGHEKNLSAMAKKALSRFLAGAKPKAAGH